MYLVNRDTPYVDFILFSLSISLTFIHNSELLYQIYTETYISKEIRRQTVCRNISKTSADFQMDCVHPRSAANSGTGTGGSRSSPIPSLRQNTLWQDLPAVRESGILQTLTPEDCKYQEVREAEEEDR